MSKPFVSFIVMSYKAEKFIQEAIDGALSQTYDNMEIIFSDDASPDKTFDIIEQNVKSYNGSHKSNIRAIKNEKNMGIGAHLNKLWWQEAKGDWIVVSAGDDISLPERVETLMKYASEDVAAIHHFSHLINDNSETVFYKDIYQPSQKVLEQGTIEDVIKKSIHLRGGTMCLNTKMIKLFNQFNEDVINEDIVLAYRSKYFGKIIHLDEKLLKYRVHANSISFNHNMIFYANYVKTTFNDARNGIAVYNQILKDNEILKLSSDFLDFLAIKNKKNEVKMFLYGSGAFKSFFIFSANFYQELLKRIALRGFLYFKKKKNNSAQ